MAAQEEPQPIWDPEYWKARIQTANRRAKPHHAIYICTKDTWDEIEQKHRQILQRVILPNESVLDVGCGWGRLLTMMPKGWAGDYIGIDLCPDFITLAVHFHPNRTFFTGTAEEVIPILADSPEDFIGPDKKFDWCVLVSIKDMIITNQGQEEWDKTEALIRRVCNRLLILEYIITDDGSVE